MNLLLAALLCLQDDAAEEAFRKIEETLQKAKTVSLDWRCAVAKKQAENAELLHVGGSILLKDPDRAFLLTDFNPRDPALKLIEVSDGIQLRQRQGLLDPKVQPAPKALRPALEYAFTRLGVYYPSVVTGSFLWARTPSRDALDGYARLAEVSQLKMGEKVREGQILSYKVKAATRNSSRPPREVDVRLLYNPVTWLPIKRILTVDSGEPSYSIAEVYDSFILNAEIPDEKFKLPAAGK